MRILVLGDLSGREADADLVSNPQIDARPIVPVDVDSFDDVLRRFAPRLQVPHPDTADPIELAFKSLEDFHPDALERNVPLLRELAELRERLLDPPAFHGATAELEALLGTSAADRAPQDTAPDQTAAPLESDDETIERLLGRPATAAAEHRTNLQEKAVAAVSTLIRNIIGSEPDSGQPPHRQINLQTLDELRGQRMRALLHAPVFQSLEAIWRSVHGLVTGLETNEGLQIHLLDVARTELAADLALSQGDLRVSGLYRLLVETGTGTPGGEPWSLLVGGFSFGPSPRDLGLLAALGSIASHAGGPFIAAASSELLGCRSLVETPNSMDWHMLSKEQESAWTSLRRSPAGPWLGLALPQVLLRLPYGKDTEPVDAFGFEELGPERRHQDYLWGNPAFACALLIGRAFEANGWSMTPGDVLDLDELPAHAYREEGESGLQACAEVYLTERSAAAILDRGIMPLLSIKGRNLVRLARFQSIASPPAPLTGYWDA